MDTDQQMNGFDGIPRSTTQFSKEESPIDLPSELKDNSNSKTIYNGAYGIRLAEIGRIITSVLVSAAGLALAIYSTTRLFEVGYSALHLGILLIGVLTALLIVSHILIAIAIQNRHRKIKTVIGLIFSVAVIATTTVIYYLIKTATATSITDLYTKDIFVIYSLFALFYLFYIFEAIVTLILNQYRRQMSRYCPLLFTNTESRRKRLLSSLKLALTICSIISMTGLLIILIICHYKVATNAAHDLIL
ncbi:hypothetical protein NEHOM01_1560 [Nematocida homosporus]|uniref:uncharacterized protein n=1 Tax=Nematocida homosporus TaxID=1912981 RepID=UPI00221F76BB|nr:uncharacterized protein NEHOM01_1560 [Nematocida homosporus]KAI5186574.1 hypothetical protein NEHOM01_1560 [Nematocida homosporus]